MCRSNLDTLTSAKKLAEAYDGLPDNVKRFHIINALKTAGDRLGFKKAHINYLELMVSYTRETDWIGCDSYPLVWLSVEEIAKKLKVSRQQVNRIEKALVSLGAIYFEDTGNYRRRGYRDQNGYVKRAFGADLRPLALLWDKISAEVDNAKQEDIDWKTTRTEVSSLRRRIGDILREKKQLVDNISSHESLYCRITHNTPIEVLKNIYSALKNILSKLDNTCRV